ncbi:hypothetical protein M0R45_019553 [Rubus argutus]|uniref:Uncharacterized protein n=1 Tax=Rubus argutus TaxID=59490 RepID=A0AAW1X9E0_RUBAR
MQVRKPAAHLCLFVPSPLPISLISSFSNHDNPAPPLLHQFTTNPPISLSLLTINTINHHSFSAADSQLTAQYPTPLSPSRESHCARVSPAPSPCPYPIRSSHHHDVIKRQLNLTSAALPLSGFQSSPARFQLTAVLATAVCPRVDSAPPNPSLPLPFLSNSKQPTPATHDPVLDTVDSGCNPGDPPLLSNPGALSLARAQSAN